MPVSLSGSLLITGSLTVTEGIIMSGSIASASYAVSSSNAFLATNVVGTANRILFNSATNTTTTSNNLTWENSINLMALGDTTGTAGTISKIALYTSSFGGYGLGVSPAQLDYVSDGSHVFYKNGVTPTELVRIANNGDVNISGSLNVINGITGNLTGTSSYATNANLLDGLDSTVFTSTASFTAQTASFTAFTSSLNTFSASILSYTSSINAKTSSFATTSSNTFIGTQTITGSLLQSGNYTTTGTITAQTINVQQVTSSIVYSCGSNNFGTAIGNTQVFTGSMFITGSNIVANVGNACFAGSVCAPAFVGGTVNGTTSTFVSGIISGTPANTSSLLLENFNGDQTATTLRLKSGRADVFYHMQAFSSNTSEVFRIEASGRIVSAAGACFGGAVCVPNIISTGASGGRYATFNAPTNGGYITFEAGGTAFGDLGSYCAQYGTGDATTLSLQSRTGYALALGTNSTEKVRIDTTGNLMVGSLSAGNAGTINVSVGCAGTTAGGLQLWATSAQTHYVQFGDGTAGAGPYAGYVGYAHATDSLLLGAGAATRAIISSTGVACFSNIVCAPNATISNCLGVGVTSPQGNFEVVGLSYFTRANNSLLVNPNYGGAGTHTQLQVVCNMALAFATCGDNERMRITSDGYVGIGTTSPNISGGLAGNTLLTMKATTAQRVAIIELNGCRSGTGEPSSYIFAYNNSCTTPFGAIRFNRGSVDGCGCITLATSGIDRLAINPSGNVGIGTTCPVTTNLIGSVTIVKSYNGDTPPSPSAQSYDINQSNLYLFGRNAGITLVGALNEEAVIAFGNPSDPYIGGIRYSMGSGADSGDLVIQTGGTNERMRITSGGFLGIGTTSPCYKLDVRNASGTGAQTIVSVVNRTNDSNTGAFIGFGDAYTDTVSPYLFAARVGGTREGAGDGGFMSFYTRPTSGFEYERMRITAGGIACFACQICAPNAVINCLGAGYAWNTSGGATQTIQIKSGLNNSGLWVESCSNDSGLYLNHSDTAHLIGGSYRTTAGFKDIAIQTAGSTRILIKCEGSVGIGTTSTSAEANLFLGAQGSIEGGQLVLQKGTSCSCATHLDNYNDSFRIMSGTDTGSTAVNMIINHTSGNVGIGTTTVDQKFVVQGPAGNWTGNFIGSSTTGQSLGLLVTAGTNSSDHAFFVQNAASSTTLFRIAGNGIACFAFTVCAPCFATISDYRMKSNIRPIEGLSIIMNTKPYKFEYNYDCSTSFGMIAHELQDTLPEAVFGQKDGEVMQGVDYMKLLPITIKAIQEQQCTICSQASTINTLKTCLGII